MSYEKEGLERSTLYLSAAVFVNLRREQWQQILLLIILSAHVTTISEATNVFIYLLTVGSSGF